MRVPAVDFLIRTIQHHTEERPIVHMGGRRVAGRVGALGDGAIIERTGLQSSAEKLRCAEHRSLPRPLRRGSRIGQFYRISIAVFAAPIRTLSVGDRNSEA